MLAGNVNIVLPEDHPTRVTVNLLAGNTIANSADGESRTTRGPFQVYVTGANLNGAATADITEVQVRLLAGNIEIDGITSADGADDSASAANAAGTAGPAGVNSSKMRSSTALESEAAR